MLSVFELIKRDYLDHLDIEIFKQFDWEFMNEDKGILDKIGTVLDLMFNPHATVRVDVQKENVAKNSLKVKELLSCERIFSVKSDIETIKAIVSIFKICSIAKPESWNVFICSPSTVIG